MVELVLTDEQARLLAEARESVEVVDPHGNRLGFFARRFSDTDVEIARKRAASGQPGIATSIVLERLSSLPRHQ